MTFSRPPLFVKFHILLALPLLSMGFTSLNKFDSSSKLLMNNFFKSFGGASNRSADDSLKIEKSKLLDSLKKVQPNGLKATVSQQLDISNTVSKLEKVNPTKSPAFDPKMNGYWRLLYTDFSPPAESSGKIGPFVGDVFQDLDSKALIIKNILKLNFPLINGALIAKLNIADKQTWKIEFQKIENKLFSFPLPTKIFSPGEQIRVWRITYLDDDLRIMRAGRPESKDSEYFIFILKREEMR